MAQNRYNFESPGAAASDALQEFLAKQEALKRQQMLDEMNAKVQAQQMAESQQRVGASQAGMARDERTDFDAELGRFGQKDPIPQSMQDRAGKLGITDSRLMQQPETPGTPAPEQYGPIAPSTIDPTRSGLDPRPEMRYQDSTEVTAGQPAVPGVMSRRQSPEERVKQEEKVALQTEFDEMLKDPSIPSWIKDAARAKFKTGLDVTEEVNPLDKNEVKEVGGYIYTRRPDGTWAKGDRARNMGAEAAAVRGQGAADGDDPSVTSEYSNERAFRTIQSVDELMKLADNSTVGFGSLLSGVPTSGALNFASQLDTLKANITFNELTQMREAAKTGGALGQVSDRENQLLGAALGGLDQKQSPDQFKAQLEKVKASVQRWQAAKAAQAGGADTNPAPAGGVIRWGLDESGNPVRLP